MTGPELCTEDQRFVIWRFYGCPEILDLTGLRADATRRLGLAQPLTDLRELTRDDAFRLIGMLAAETAARLREGT